MRENNLDLKKKAFYLTVLSNLLFFLLLMIVVAWKETYPPPEEYGIELGGDSENLLENSLESEESNSENIEEDLEENLDVKNKLNSNVNEDVIENISKQSKPSNQEKSDVQESFPVEESTNTVNSEKIIDDSDDKLLTDSSKINNNAPSSKIIDERAIFSNKSSSESGSKGSSLEMLGWVWDFEPKPIDNSRESGRIVFEITVDYYGEIISLKTLETTLSPAVENIYKEEVLKLTFSPTNNENPADLSKGKITFIIKNN